MLKVAGYGILAILGLSLLGYVLDFVAQEPSVPEATRKEGVESRAKVNARTDLRTNFDNANNELVDINFSELLDDDQTILAAANIFAVFGQYLEDAAASGDYSADELSTFKARLGRAQVKQMPILRDAYGPALRKSLWEHDITAKTIGAGYRTIEFAGGTFAANRNKKEFQTQIRKNLILLRFNRAQYKWYAQADEYSYYTIDGYPKDSDIAKANSIGILKLIEGL